MKCVKCKKNFNPREETVEQLHGYEDTVEVKVSCPHCEANYSCWISTGMWNHQED